MYPEKNMFQKDTHTPMFIAALFTIAKTWKQPKYLTTDEQIKKMWYIHTVEYYSAIKKNEIMPFAATWMDLQIIILSEVRQKKTKYITYHMIYMCYMCYICVICGTNELIYKTETDSQAQKTNLLLPKCGRDK